MTHDQDIYHQMKWLEKHRDRCHYCQMLENSARPSLCTQAKKHATLLWEMVGQRRNEIRPFRYTQYAR